MESLEQKYAQTLEVSNLSLKQRRVLLSSLKLFSEIGFENTTSSLIAERAGVSEGTVFSYFKTKEGILEVILSTFLEQVIPEVIADFSEKKFTANQESFPVFLRSIVRDRLVFVQENQMHVKILLGRSFIDKNLSIQLGNIIVQSIIEPISPVLNQFKEKGLILNWSNERIVRYILALSLTYVLPMMLNEGKNIYAYPFYGYWKDVGTIESLWEANMEYISPENALDSRNRQWKIYSRNLISPPNFLGANAHVEDSLVVDGCFVDGTVKHSILSTGAQVREGAEVLDSVIMSGAIIGHGAKIKRAIIGEGAVISDGVEIDGTEEVQVVGYNEVVGVATDED